FLDEVGDLRPDLQPKLLRLLESKEYRRLGDSKDRTGDFRILAATHRDLEADVKSGRFREDLYFRLAVVRLDIPPLPHPMSALRLTAPPLGRQSPGFPGKRAPPPPAGFQSGRWPGTVRGLRNARGRVTPRGAPGAQAPSSDVRVPAAPAADSFNEARRQALWQ